MYLHVRIVVVFFLFLLIQEHTVESHACTLTLLYKSHCVSHTHTSKYPRVHTRAHALCSPLLWLSAGLGILMSLVLFVNAAN